MIFAHSVAASEQLRSCLSGVLQPTSKICLTGVGAGLERRGIGMGLWGHKKEWSLGRPNIHVLSTCKVAGLLRWAWMSLISGLFQKTHSPVVPWWPGENPQPSLHLPQRSPIYLLPKSPLTARNWLPVLFKVGGQRVVFIYPTFLPKRDDKLFSKNYTDKLDFPCQPWPKFFHKDALLQKGIINQHVYFQV